MLITDSRRCRDRLEHALAGFDEADRRVVGIELRALRQYEHQCRGLAWLPAVVHAERAAKISDLEVFDRLPCQSRGSHLADHLRVEIRRDSHHVAAFEVAGCEGDHELLHVLWSVFGSQGDDDLPLRRLDDDARVRLRGRVGKARHRHEQRAERCTDARQRDDERAVSHARPLTSRNDEFKGDRAAG